MGFLLYGFFSVYVYEFVYAATPLFFFVECDNFLYRGCVWIHLNSLVHRLFFGFGVVHKLELNCPGFCLPSYFFELMEIFQFRKFPAPYKNNLGIGSEQEECIGIVQQRPSDG